jgi:hypothetical protein
VALDKERARKLASREALLSKIELGAVRARRRVTAELLLLYFLVVYLVTTLGVSAAPGLLLSAAVTLVGFWKAPNFLLDPVVTKVAEGERAKGRTAHSSLLDALDD